MFHNIKCTCNTHFSTFFSLPNPSSVPSWSFFNFQHWKRKFSQIQNCLWKSGSFVNCGLQKRGFWLFEKEFVRFLASCSEIFVRFFKFVTKPSVPFLFLSYKFFIDRAYRIFLLKFEETFCENNFVKPSNWKISHFFSLQSLSFQLHNLETLHLPIESVNKNCFNIIFVWWKYY